MVGVIFLLYSDAKFDREVIETLLQQQQTYGFKLVLLSQLTKHQLQLFKSNSLEADTIRQQAIQETKNAMSTMKKDWKENYILYPIYFKEQLDMVTNRTYYISVKFEVPIIDKFKANNPDTDLSEFVELESIVLLQSHRSTLTSCKVSTSSI